MAYRRRGIRELLTKNKGRTLDWKQKLKITKAKIVEDMVSY